LTHGITGVTVTNVCISAFVSSVSNAVEQSKLYTHWKASLIGHSDSNGAEDTPITVTMASNYWFNLSSRTPSFRFGHGHIFNNVRGTYINRSAGADIRFPRRCSIPMTTASTPVTVCIIVMVYR
jgi:pectate lyase